MGVRQRPRRTPWLRALLAAGLALFVPLAMAQGVAVLLSGEGGGYRELLDAFRARLADTPGLRVEARPLGGEALERLLAGGPRLLVAVGTEATRAALAGERKGVPVLAVLIPRSAFEHLRDEFRAAAGGLGAVFLDQPPERHAALLRAVLPGAKRAGAIVGAGRDDELRRLEAALAARGVALSAEVVARDSELYPALQRLTAETAALIAIPDVDINKPENVQNLLLTSFRQRTPLFAYSAAFVRAGALAAVFSSPHDVGAEAADLARARLAGAPLPAPGYPRNFSVAVNRHIAEALALEPPDEARLRARILEAAP